MNMAERVDGSELTDAQRSFDDLVQEAVRYRSGAEFAKLLDFVRRFRRYSPFNGMLVHLQREGATFATTSARWRRDYRRVLRPGAQPLLILQPFGPVMLVYDVADTLALEGAPPLPREVDRPFDMGLFAGAATAYPLTVANAKRDGIRVSERQLGSQAAGSITHADGGSQEFSYGGRPAKSVSVPVRFEVVVNSDHTVETRHATLLHELGHLFCGHLGQGADRLWPDRPRVPPEVRELEAETVSFVVASRLDPHVQYPPYLSSYVSADQALPPISLSTVLKAAGEIEQMGRVRLGLRDGSRRMRGP